MQTFLPYHDNLELSAEALDGKRLGKQRVETMQILTALTGLKPDPDFEENGRVIAAISPPWIAKHPVTLMWRGHEGFLYHYGMAICDAWVARGYRDGCKAKINAIYKLWVKGGNRDTNAISTRPDWLDAEIASRYRALLMGKKPEHYAQFGWTEEPIYKMIYPRI